MNRFTSGTEGINYKIPINEDKIILVVIQSLDGNLVKGIKVWDKKETILTAWNFCKKTLIVGQIAIFCRVGQYDSDPINPQGFELRKKDIEKVSWICFSFLPIIFIKDLGNNQGIEVVFDGSTFKETHTKPLPLQALDSKKHFHNGVPPFVEGRIYWGYRINNTFLVILQGFGEKAKTLYPTLGGNIEVDIDSTGKILDFRRGLNWIYKEQIYRL